MSNCEFRTKQGLPCKGRPMTGCLHEGKRACRAHMPASTPQVHCAVTGCGGKASMSRNGHVLCKHCHRAITWLFHMAASGASGAGAAPTPPPPPKPAAPPPPPPPPPPPKPKPKPRKRTYVPPPPMASRRQDYEILGLASPFATKREIRMAYYRKAKELHPDRNPNEDAKQKFQEVQAAYARMSGLS